MGVENPENMIFISKMIGTCIAVFFGICFFIGVCCDNEKIKPLTIPEKFDIGYINDCPISNYIELEKDKIQPEKTKKNTSKTIKDIQQPNNLIEECITALVSLGEKRAVAKSIVNNYFINNPTTQSIEQFISGVFKK